jgi:DNA-binding NtrC family response regulator
MNVCKSHTVLVVDDDVELTGLLKKNFMKLECEVEIANSIEEARCILRKNIISLIVLDLKFPGDGEILSGLFFISEIKELYPKIGIIVLTGNLTQEAAITALNAGADAFMIKPFSVKELNVLTEEMLSKTNEQDFHEALEKAYFRIGRAYTITLDALEQATIAAQEVIDTGKANGVIIDAFIKERNSV